MLVFWLVIGISEFILISAYIILSKEDIKDLLKDLKNKKLKNN